MARGRNWKWFDYYWNFFKELGAETYKTWRWELLASILIVVFVALISGNWKDFRTALLATGMTLGCFVVWHALRIPWLLHRSTHTIDSDRGTAAGVFGIAVIAAVLIGGMALGRVLWSARPLGTIDVHLESPRGPVVTVEQIAPPVKERCWINNYSLPAISVSPAGWGIATIVCNTTIKPPYSIVVNYDQTVTAGPFTFPVGSEFLKSTVGNEGNKVVAIVEIHTIIPNEPFSIMARGSNNNTVPLVKAATIRAKGRLLEFKP